MWHARTSSSLTDDDEEEEEDKARRHRLGRDEGPRVGGSERKLGETAGRSIHGRMDRRVGISYTA